MKKEVSDPVTVGVVTKPHGIRGELKIIPQGISAERLSSLGRVQLQAEDRSGSFTVLTVRSQPGVLIFRLAECTDRTAAESWRGADVQVHRDELPPAEPGEYEPLDLKGFRVETTAGRQIGILKDVLRYTGQDILQIDADGRELLVPAVESFVKFIDSEKRTITIQPIDGLLDINEV